MSALLSQLVDIADVLGFLGVAGVLYYIARGRRYLRTPALYMALSGALVGSYVLLFALFGRASERYYRPLAPLLFVPAGAGYYCFYRDMARRKILCWTVAVLVVGACFFDALKEPMRAHRVPQKKAGRWLKKHASDYSGFVLSSYHQPVFYAGMRYISTRERHSKKAYHQLVAAGHSPRYLILDGSDAKDYPWLTELVESEGWKRIYAEDKRRIRIYERIQKPQAKEAESPPRNAAGSGDGE